MLLSFDKPQKIRSTEEHNEKFMSDSGVNGTFVPNMSDVDNERFKAKHIKGNYERIEIKVYIGKVNCSIKVFKERFNPKYPDSIMPKYKEERDKWNNRHQDIHFSINGKMDLTFNTWNQINEAIEEAKNILFNSKNIT